MAHVNNSHVDNLIHDKSTVLSRENIRLYILHILHIYIYIINIKCDNKYDVK